MTVAIRTLKSLSAEYCDHVERSLRSTHVNTLAASRYAFCQDWVVSPKPAKFKFNVLHVCVKAKNCY